MTSIHEKFMGRALELAHRGEGRTSPNPPVGAVLVREGAIVGEGFHPEAGQPHAEVFALNDAGEIARGADLYVTLEPCCHHGRTGPCVDAIISAGVKSVYVGSVDPNPHVAGRGLEKLKEAGLTVESGVLESDCSRLIAPFAKHVTTGRPFVILKTAMTLDGQTATSRGESRWISCEESRAQVHRLRHMVDGIMVGSGTVLADDPRLTTRLDGEDGRSPVRIVVDGSLRTSAEAKAYDDDSVERYLLTTDQWSEAELKPYTDRSVRPIQVSSDQEGLNLAEAMSRLGQAGIQSVLLEGGATLSRIMLKAGLVDRVMLFVAPTLLGGDDGRGLFAGAGVEALSDAYRLTDLRVQQVGCDLLVEGEVVSCSQV